MNELAIAILVTAGVTYLLRALPLLLVRGRIESRRVRSFLHYTPYAVLTAITLPAVFFATSTPLSAILGVSVAVWLALRGRDLLQVALAAAVVVWAAEAALALLG